jgi:hypothetical protein
MVGRYVEVTLSGLVVACLSLDPRFGDDGFLKASGTTSEKAKA